jgi:CheY-like chemotaxis protein
MTEEKKAKTILLVDDEKDIAELTRMRILSMGYNVVLAGDGEEALVKIKKEHPDLILLDVKMPKLDGYQVCKTVKNDPLMKDIPIILFTASSRHVMELSDRALELGAASCIKKPFDSKELLAEIKKLIG